MAGDMRSRYRRAVARALPVVAALLLSTLALPAAGASGSCSDASGAVTVELPETDSIIVRVGRRAISIEGASCSPLALRDVTRVDLSQTGDRDTSLTFDLRRRAGGARSIDLDLAGDLGAGGDSVTVLGGARDDRMTTSSSGLRFASGSDRIDLLVSGVEYWDLRGGRGNDFVRQGFTGSRATSSTTTAGTGTPVTGPNTIMGGPGNDTISGTDGVNVIWAGEGNDTVYAKSGDDEVQGGSGDDTLWGGGGDDLLNGGDGNDKEYGADSNDVFIQTPQTFFASSTTPTTLVDGKDTYSSITVPSGLGPSYDVNARIYIDHPDTAELTVTLISPNNRIVRLVEKRGNGSSLMGTQFDSEAFTHIKAAGNRNLAGRFHPEWSMEPLTQFDPAGTWRLRVFDATDPTGNASGALVHWNLDFTFATDLPNGNDELTGGNGTYDLLSYAARTQGVTVTATGQTADDGQLGEFDNVGKGGPDIETQYGGLSDDSLSGTESKDDLRGLFGNDILNGLGNNDQLRGGNGQDTINGGAGPDAIHGHGNADAIDGGTEFDRVFYDYSPVGMTIDLALGTADDNSETGNDNDALVNVEYANGTKYADTMSGDALNNQLLGGAGDDFLDGRDGTNDRLEGAAGFDTCMNGEIVVTCEG